MECGGSLKGTRSEEKISKNDDFSLWGNHTTTPNAHLKLGCFYFLHFSSLCVLITISSLVSVFPQHMDTAGWKMLANNKWNYNMALSKTTRILALFILGLSVACVALLVALVIKTNTSDSGMAHTMYDFHDSTDTLKFWTEIWAINKTFLFFIWFWWNLVKL